MDFSFFKKTRLDVTLWTFGKICLFLVTSGLVKGLHPVAWSLLQLSIPVNMPVITMTTVVQKQTVLGLHMYKMHILVFVLFFSFFFFISYVFDLFRYGYRDSTFFLGTFCSNMLSLTSTI